MLRLAYILVAQIQKGKKVERSIESVGSKREIRDPSRSRVSSRWRKPDPGTSCMSSCWVMCHARTVPYSYCHRRQLLDLVRTGQIYSTDAQTPNYASIARLMLVAPLLNCMNVCMYVCTGCPARGPSVTPFRYGLEKSHPLILCSGAEGNAIRERSTARDFQVPLGARQKKRRRGKKRSGAQIEQREENQKRQMQLSHAKRGARWSRIRRD